MSAQLPGVQPAHTALSSDDPREIGGYRLHARLGAGGMGVVYLAYTPGGRPIALKAVRAEFAADPEFRERFAQEVASARRIHGLFTAQVVDHGVDARTPWLATAYVPGPSLQQVVQRHGPLPVRTVLLLVAGIAEALQGIHGVGVVHRDLKPANVLIAADGPRVIDFGIARAADATALTGAGLRIGTAAFMAPEQALGLRATAATDVFALGALAVYVSGGAPPFGSGPESAALYRVVHEAPDLSFVPAVLRDLLGRCLAKRPEDRPSTAALIAAVHAHPAVGPRPEFADDWLPHPVSADLAGHGGGPGPPHVQPTVTATAFSSRSPHEAADAVTGSSGGTSPAGSAGSLGGTGTAPPGGPEVHRPEAHPGARAHAPSSRRAPRRGGRLLLTVLVALLALVVGGAAVYYLDPPPEEGPDPAGATGEPSARPPISVQPSSGAPKPSGAASYTAGYTGVTLTSPDASYEFDLTTGKVVPGETAAWYLARTDKAFVLPEESDAFIAGGDALTPADCARGIESEPVTTLPFAELADERPFCVRGADQKEIVIARLVEAAGDGGSVTVVLDRHRRDG
ncbi:serine/threonine-protein kinase [Streptomyces sp. NBC_00691]|uniref:serine/threonine-protein kinase n=1 Tax=Streptomyces sp. NBC_00691 TaxID=2903671 RepID=UPI002E303F7D|nr:serine/threonine-protein kinase [Streptomyces sp. NBC_00691]